MLKLLSYPLSILYYFSFLVTLLIFEVIQRVCYFGFGYKAHKWSVDALQFFLMRCQNLLGTTYSYSNPYILPKDRPTIIVANHQSMYDITPIIWFLRDRHPKFVSKKELGKGVPSISFNLKYGGSVLIDRKNKKESVIKINEFAKRIEKNKHAAVIFPEGTRSKTGVPKPFRSTGLLTLFDQIPNAVVVPLTIENSWKITKYGNFPLFLGAKVKLTVHEPKLVQKIADKEAYVKAIENTITANLIST